MWTLEAAWAMDVNTDPDYSRTTEPAMILGSSSGLDVIMTLGGSEGHPGWHGPRGRAALR